MFTLDPLPIKEAKCEEGANKVSRIAAKEAATKLNVAKEVSKRKTTEVKALTEQKTVEDAPARKKRKGESEVSKQASENAAATKKLDDKRVSP